MASALRLRKSMTITARRPFARYATFVAVLAGAAWPNVGAAACVPGFQDDGGGVCSRTFVVTLAPETVVLPAQIGAVTAIVSGAEGGSSLEEQVDPFGGAASPGGKGGRESAVVPIVPGATLTVVVGEAGTGGVLAPPGFGGYGGGGHATSRYGGNGGGGSFLFDDAGVLVAAGGGGGGGYDYGPVVCGRGDQQAPGGAGSGAAPALDGQSTALRCDPSAHFPAGGGAGATQTSGGAGGHPALPPGYAFGQVDGDAGYGPAIDPYNFGMGGSTHNGCCFYTGWAAGGGGGYFGGGGGGNIESDLEGGGGGGGAGYVTPAAISSASQTGAQIGDGEVVLRYYTGACNASCATCSGPSSSQCVTCPSGFHVDGGVCVEGTTTTTSTTLPAVCGDGILDAGESCDDGALNGTTASCCTLACLYADAGSPCADDGDLCTSDTCDGSGACVHAEAPAAPCTMPLATLGAKVTIVSKPPGAPDVVKFQWAKGPDVTPDAFGAPDATTAYALCVYDQANGIPSAVYHAGPSATCGATSCWKRVPKPPKATTGWKLADKTGGPDGIVKVLLKSGLAGKAKVQVVAGKRDLVLGPLPLLATPSVIAQVRTSDGACWGATFAGAGITKNDGAKFTAKSE